ncbi:sodium/potassium/calcium exchanger 4-like [Lissotriton helveticus]
MLELATWKNRKLMATENGSLESLNCTPAAINEFPTDIFTKEERKMGAVLLHISCALYMFYALAIVCDEYFVPSLVKMCEKLNLSEDVAGATFMAAGSSSPELFASIIGVFITHGDVGVATIVGSAVFNVLFVVGICGIFTVQVVQLMPYPLLRNFTCYTISVIALIIFITDGIIEWWESLILIFMYAIYILVMKYNKTLQNLFTRSQKTMANESAVSNGMGDASYDITHEDPSLPLLGKGEPKPIYNGKDSVAVVDEIISSSPSKIQFPDTGLQIMITNNFGPITRLTMPLHSASNEIVPSSDGKLETFENGTACADKSDLQEEPESSHLSPCSVPDTCLNKCKWAFTWPITCIFYLTIPNFSKPRRENLFLVTFLVSILWIGMFSYILVWMVTVIGYTLGIPDVIMGITFLAAGSSVPDCIASVIVARQGSGDMAVSNSIGSNVFDILVCLGVPWFLQTVAIQNGSVVRINSRGLVYSVILLLGSVALTVLGVHVNKWRLDKKLGAYVLSLYVLFLCFSILIEMNVFTFLNLPMC